MVPRFLIVGGGNMARAIVHGAARAGLRHFERAAVVEPDVSKHSAFVEHGIEAFTSGSRALAARAGRAEPLAILLAVKPQMLAEVASDLGPGVASGDPLILSILAGTTIERLGAAFPGCRRVIRVMPNLPASIGLGATALSPAPAAGSGDVALARTLFEATGPLVVTLDESLMDAFTAVAGSGPAYLFLLAEAMCRAAERLGIDASTAAAITRQTLLGAAELLWRSPESPEALRAAVTSKGGTTAAATAVLGARDVVGAFADAITAARDRGRELSRL